MTEQHPEPVTSDEAMVREVGAMESELAFGPVVEGDEAALHTPEGASDGIPRVRQGAGYITLVTLAVFGAYIALVTPIAISLALRVEQLSPGHPELLGYITGIGAVVALVVTPIVGMLSDRTRSRWGRRRPYIVGGIILGVAALILLAIAPSITMLGAAWVLTQLSWGVGVLSGLTYSQADKLPEEQRGKVSGLVGFVQNLGPVVGAGIVSALIGQNLLVFLIPGAIGIITVLIFVILVKDDPNPALVNTEKLNPSKIFENLIFSPRKYPDFGWNCLGRVFFNLGLSFATTFTTFFFASRLGVQVKDIGGVIVILSLGGVVAGALGALGGGWISDKLRRRRALVVSASVLFTVGVVTMALGSGLPVLIGGSLLTTIGIGVFMSVDQAIVFDILPERDTDAGRFLGINNYATMLPQAVGPLLASVILVIGASAGGQNYTLLFVVAAVLTLIGAFVIQTRVKGTR